MRVHPLWAVPVLALTSTACVTVNIYFPAAAAEKVADRIVQEVYKAGAENKNPQPGQPKPAAPTPAPAQVPPQSALPRVEVLAQALLTSAFSAISGSAEAVEANLDIDSPAIRKLRQSLEARAAQLQPLLASGALGLSNDGLVVIRDATKLPLAQRAQANALVQAENADRRQLYQAIATANAHPEWAGDIQRTFAGSWIKNAQGGWWVQSPDGAWKQK